MKRLLTMALLVGALGCGGGPPVEKRDVIALADVPANVMDVAKKNLPDVKFNKAWRKANGEYEVSGKASNGKVREIDIKPDGTVVEIE